MVKYLRCWFICHVKTTTPLKKVTLSFSASPSEKGGAHMTKTSTQKDCCFCGNKENLWTSVNYSPEFIYLQSTYDSPILTDTGIPQDSGENV